MFASLSKVYDEHIVKKILKSSRYDEEVICSKIPYLCNTESDEMDEETEAKLRILATNPSFFIYFSDLIDTVPDLRSLSKESKEGFIVRPWNPWIELSEEFDVLQTAEDRGNKMDMRFFSSLMPRKRPRFDPFSFKNVEMRDFFYTYPVISYLFFLLDKNLPVAISYDYPRFDILPRMTKIDPYLIQYVRSVKAAEWILGDINPLTVIEKRHKWRILSNIFVLEWLANKGVLNTVPEKDLLNTISKNDELSLFRRVYTGKYIDEWFKTLIEYKSKEISLYLLDRDHVFNDIIEGKIKYSKKQDVNFLLDVLSEKYGIQRFYGRIDSLELAIVKELSEWIKILPRESFINSIVSSYTNEEYHPMAFAFESHHSFTKDFLKDIIPYLLSIYRESLKDILYQLVIDRHVSGVETIVSYKTFLKEVLAEAISFVHANNNEDGENENLILSLSHAIPAADPNSLPSLKISLQ